MASKGEQIDTSAVNQSKKKAFKKSIYRGVELEKLIEYNMDALVKLMGSRQKRRFSHGIH